MHCHLGLVKFKHLKTEYLKRLKRDQTVCLKCKQNITPKVVILIKYLCNN